MKKEKISKDEQMKMRQRSRRKIMIETQQTPPRSTYHTTQDRYLSTFNALSEEFLLLLEEDLDIGDYDE